MLADRKQTLAIATCLLAVPYLALMLATAAFTPAIAAQPASAPLTPDTGLPLKSRVAKNKLPSSKETVRHIEELLQHSNKSAALALLETQNLQQAKDPQLLQAICNAYLACDQQDNFYKTLEQWLAVEPTNSDVLLELAQGKLDRGEVKEAGQLFLRAHKSAPDNATICLRAGLGLSNCGQRDWAITALQECYRREPNNMVALETLALICASQHNWEACSEWADCLIKTEPDYTYGYVLKAWSLLRQANFREAYQHMNRAKELSPAAEINNLQGIFLMEAGEPAAARQELESSAFRANNEASLVNYLNSLSLLGQHDKVRELLAGKASFLSKHPYFSPQLALFLANSNELAAASRLLESPSPQIEEQPPSNQALIDFARATIEEKNHNLKQALTYVKKAAEIESEGAPLQAKAAELALELHQYKDAFHLAQQALQVNPSYLPAKFVLGRCMFAQKNYQGAIGILKEVVSYHKSDIRVWNYLGLSQLAQKDLEAATHSFEKAIQLNPNNQEARLGKIACCFAEKKAALAQTLLSSLLNNSRDDLKIYLALLDTEEKTGNYAAGKKILQQALKAFPKEESLLDYQHRFEQKNR